MRRFRAASAPVEDTTAPPPVLFVHVMKTGGTSVRRTLRETYRLDEVYPYAPLDLRHDEAGRLDLVHHVSLPYVGSLAPARRAGIRVYIGHFPYVVRALLGVEVQVATLLRDPVERTISLLHQLQRAQPWEEADGPRPLAGRPLEEVYERPDVFGPLVQDHQTKVFSMTLADEPHSYLDLVDVDRARLAVAKAALEEIEVLGTMEHFEDFMVEASTRFGWNRVAGARKNATDTEEPSGDAALRRRIAADNALDMELYDHARSLVAGRRRRQRA